MFGRYRESEFNMYDPLINKQECTCYANMGTAGRETLLYAFELTRFKSTAIYIVGNPQSWTCLYRQNMSFASLQYSYDSNSTQIQLQRKQWVCRSALLQQIEANNGL